MYAVDFTFLFRNISRGYFCHSGLGAPCQVYDDRSSKWLAVLRPTPDLHTLALRHRTQIIVSSIPILDPCF